MFKREAKMTVKEKSELRKEILKVTPSVSVPKAPATKPVKQSPKAQAVAKVLANMPSGWNGDERGALIVGAFEALLGEKLVLHTAPATSDVPRIDKSNILKFQAIVPEGSQGHHQVPVGKVAILTQNGDRQAMSSDGKTGIVTRSYCRYATVKEIDAFLNDLQKNANVLEVASALS